MSIDPIGKELKEKSKKAPLEIVEEISSSERSSKSVSSDSSSSRFLHAKDDNGEECKSEDSNDVEERKSEDSIFGDENLGFVDLESEGEVEWYMDKSPIITIEESKPYSYGLIFS